MQEPLENPQRMEKFEQVWSRHAPFLNSVLWKLTGDQELFAEAMQYSLMQIWRHLDKLGGEKASAYIYRIALSSNQKAWQHRVGRDKPLVTKQPASPGAGEGIASPEWEEKVRKAILHLPEKQARAIIMRYFEQKDYATIARELDCSPTTAKMSIFRAIAKLKNKLKTLQLEGHLE